MLAATALIAVLAAACAPAARQDASSDAAPMAPTTRKVLNIAIPGQPPSPSLGLIGASIPGDSGHRHLVPLTHDALSVEWFPGFYQGQLATTLPTIENGGWRLNSDGTMDLIWRLHQNVRWHDGSPFTSNDLLFSYTVYADPSYPNQGEAGKLMDSAAARSLHVRHPLEVGVRAGRSPGAWRLDPAGALAR